MADFDDENVDNQELEEINEIGDDVTQVLDGFDPTAEEESGMLVQSGDGYRIVPLKGMFENWFLDYSSYVILDRAVPEIDDGLKPVQRRILHSMKEIDDGRYNKVANIVGNTMKYHPHGDASIGDALVNLGQKDLLIDCQGNWGNILTGDGAAAPRYIEARLSKFALDVVFNPKTTDWTFSYDGRNKEPISLPVKFPLLLFQGAMGIAVGLKSEILPHNFNELIDASIAYLKDEPFELYPDFQTGGLIDVRGYNDGGRGSRVQVRAKISQLDKKTLVITEIPYGTTTETLIQSITQAGEKGKIKIRRVDDNTSKNAEIVIHLAPGVSPDQTIDALYAFTKCQVKLNSLCTCVIHNDKPEFTTVSAILRHNTDHTLDLLSWELQNTLEELEGQWHWISLEKIFFEKRLYKILEKDAPSFDAQVDAIEKAFDPYREQLKKEITRDDVLKLCEKPVRKISKFDIKKAEEGQGETEQTEEDQEQTEQTEETPAQTDETQAGEDQPTAETGTEAAVDAAEDAAGKANTSAEGTDVPNESSAVGETTFVDTDSAKERSVPGKLIDSWTSDGKAHAVSGLIVGHTYRLVEESAPEGFAIAQPRDFKVTKEDADQKIALIDRQILVSKVDTEITMIAGAHLQVVDQDGKIIDNWVSDGTAHAVSGLVVGQTYTLIETEAPEGYVLASPIEFTVSDQADANDELNLVNKQVKVTKTDLTGEKEVEGAHLSVVEKETGKTADTWTSGKEAHPVSGLEVGKTYVLTETRPADGYVTAESIEFTVEDDFKSELHQMKDDVTRLKISKEDITNSKELPGAQLVIRDSEGNEVEKWTSAEEPHYIEMLPIGTYTLTEAAPPALYMKAEDVQFEVKDTGEIQTVTMLDKPTTVVIHKKDIVDGENGEELPGAKLEVRDSSGKVIDSWTSGTTPHEIAYLAPGTYTLTEVTAPSGYDVAENVSFSVADNGQVQHVTMYDSPKEEKIDLTGKKKTTTQTTPSGGGSYPSGGSTPTAPVKTGDNSPILLYVGILGAAAFGIVLLLILKKKRENDSEE